MKSLILAFTLISSLAFASTINPHKLQGHYQKGLGQVRGLIQFQTGGGSGPREVDPEADAFINFTLESILHPLFVDVALTVCGSKVATPQNRKPLDPTKMADVASFNVGFSILAAARVAHAPGSERLSENEFLSLVEQQELDLYAQATQGCIAGMSKAAALKAQKEGVVSTFLVDFNSQIIAASKKIIADWEAADPKATETYSQEYGKIILEITNKMKEPGNSQPGGLKKTSVGVRAL